MTLYTHRGYVRVTFPKAFGHEGCGLLVERPRGKSSGNMRATRHTTRAALRAASNRLICQPVITPRDTALGKWKTMETQNMDARLDNNNENISDQRSPVNRFKWLPILFGALCHRMNNETNVPLTFMKCIPIVWKCNGNMMHWTLP